VQGPESHFRKRHEEGGRHFAAPSLHVTLSRFCPIAQALDLMAGSESTLASPRFPFQLGSPTPLPYNELQASQDFTLSRRPLPDSRTGRSTTPFSNAMKAIMKCSNCGAEMSNLNMTWGRRQLWFIIPAMLLGFFPLIKMTFFKGDVTKDLTVSNIQTRVSGTSLEIVGLITNSSSREWSGVTVESEFFDASGNFVDEASEYLRSDISGNSKEHFKIVIHSPPEAAVSGSIKPIVKISGGHTNPF
jgi:hypothetical protein